MKLAVDDAFVVAKVFGCDEYLIVYFEANREMGCILKLVADVAPEIGHMSAHAQRLQRTQHPARIEFPAVVGVIQVTVGSKIVMGDHHAFLHPR